MPITNTYDLYNLSLSSDQPLVTAIITDIYNILAISVVNSTLGSAGSAGTAGSSGNFVSPNSFDYKLTNVLGGLSMLQSNRVVDRVLCILRAGGIRCTVKNVGVSPGPDTNLSTPYYTPWFNNVTAMLDTITVTWFSRTSQEYLKTYC